MSENQRPVVEKIIDRFKSQLDESLREQIGNAAFTDLAIMIDQAITAEVAGAADLVEEVAKKLRAGSRGPELGL